MTMTPPTEGRLPDWIDPGPWLDMAAGATERDVRRALSSPAPAEREFAALVSPAAAPYLEHMAQRARTLTRAHFGRTVSLYVPLYLSNHCPGGCAYCGFAADRDQPRSRLGADELIAEVMALKAKGFEDVLLLSGERCPEADFGYVRDCVAAVVEHFHNVTIESFAMSTEEYAELERLGCTGLTLYQETYDPGLYARLHRWGGKRDYGSRLEAPARALSAGLRTAGLGVLLGLGDPQFDTLCLFRHALHLRKRYWRSGVLLSFPRVRPQRGDYHAATTVDDRLLAQIVFAFRLCLPDTHLVLSTRESPAFRDGMAGIGISRMSVESRTTVGGYTDAGERTGGQFEVSDDRDTGAFRGMLTGKGLEPVFKNWDAVFQRPTL
jgi:2-iminoacetate synthase